MVTKEQAAQVVRHAQFRSGVSWKAIAEAIGRPPVWTVAALLGQHPLSAEEAATVAELLDLDEDVVHALRMQPYRGSGAQEVPTDPTVYRLYEAIDVYGPAIKELIHEEFGDGIMSAINFKVDVERREDPTGDRVVITLDGKFLDYNW
ncbi:MAG TPA: cyanase [Actinomycetaceae bacterium]|nr:cyanase [Actinomycetaceae bacterium]